MNLTTDQISIMLDMQDETNKLIDENWREKNHPYLRAAMMEAAEAIEHHGYKWWKKQECDLQQLQMELVDIWHFALSNYLVNYESLNKEFLPDFIRCRLEECRDEICKLSFNAYDRSLPNHYLSDCENVLEKLQLFIAFCALDSFNESLFLSILKDCEMTPQDLFTMYVGKNVLNKFRQKNGYKEGTYIKNWSTVPNCVSEDNQYLTEYIKVLDVKDKKFPEFLYSMLEQYYQTVKNAAIHQEECYINREQSKCKK